MSHPPVSRNTRKYFLCPLLVLPPPCIFLRKFSLLLLFVLLIHFGEADQALFLVKEGRYILIFQCSNQRLENVLRIVGTVNKVFLLTPPYLKGASSMLVRFRLLTPSPRTTHKHLPADVRNYVVAGPIDSLRRFCFYFGFFLPLLC